MFHLSRSSSSIERQAKCDWQGQVFVQTVCQKAQAELKQTQITAISALQQRQPAILFSQPAQIHDPQVGQTRCQQQPRQPFWLREMAFVDLKAATFLIRKEGFNPESQAIPAE